MSQRFSREAGRFRGPAAEKSNHQGMGLCSRLISLLKSSGLFRIVAREAPQFTPATGHSASGNGSGASEDEATSVAEVEFGSFPGRVCLSPTIRSEILEVIPLDCVRRRLDGLDRLIRPPHQADSPAGFGFAFDCGSALPFGRTFSSSISLRSIVPNASVPLRFSTGRTWKRPSRSTSPEAARTWRRG